MCGSQQDAYSLHSEIRQPVESHEPHIANSGNPNARTQTLGNEAQIMMLSLFLCICLSLRILLCQTARCCDSMHLGVSRIWMEVKQGVKSRANSNACFAECLHRMCLSIHRRICFSILRIFVLIFLMVGIPQLQVFHHMLHFDILSWTSVTIWGISFALIAAVVIRLQQSLSRRLQWFHRFLRTDPCFMHPYRRPMISRKHFRRCSGQSKYCKSWHPRVRRVVGFGCHIRPKHLTSTPLFRIQRWCCDFGLFLPTIFLCKILVFAQSWQTATSIPVHICHERHSDLKLHLNYMFQHCRLGLKWRKRCNHRLRFLHGCWPFRYFGCCFRQNAWNLNVWWSNMYRHGYDEGHFRCKTSKSGTRDNPHGKAHNDDNGCCGANEVKTPFPFCLKSWTFRFWGMERLVLCCLFTCVSIQVDYSPWCGQRVGEACNPGPPNPEDQQLDIGTFNPTALLGKEQDVINFGRGIYGASETSVTATSQPIIRNQFQKAGFYTSWSKPVEPQKQNVSLLRGKASGTAIISSFPLRPYPEPMSKELWDTHRYVDAVVQLHTNCVLYFGSLYGAANTPTHVDPLALTNSVFQQAAERAMNFQGPAVIVGDFNWNLCDLAGWHTLVKMGWMDAAIVDSQIHGRNPQPTCKDSTRKSFILMNKAMTGVLQECRTQDDYLFSAHPLLLGRFRLVNLCQPTLQWVLPRATDEFLFDDSLAEDQAQRQYNIIHDKFNQALQQHHMDEAANMFARTVQEVWKTSCVDCEGQHVYIKPGFLKRDQFEPLKMAFNSIPVVRAARYGDYDPKIGQTNVSLRRHIRQLRRLESLVRQIHAWKRKPSFASHAKCVALRAAIRNATGFHHSFCHWIWEHLEWFVPLNLPTIEYCTELKNHYATWHARNVQWYFLQKRAARKTSIALDIQQGGPNSFREVRDPSPLPLSYVTETLHFPIKKTRISKNGTQVLTLAKFTQVDLTFPIEFHKQKCYIKRQDGCNLLLDCAVNWRDHEAFFTQKVASADPSCMHSMLFHAWDTHWKRDEPLNNDGLWEDIQPFLDKVPQVTPAVTHEFSLDVWKQHCSGLNMRAARGGCGFSVREMCLFPPTIVKLLFSLFRACEHGAPWPKHWIMAKVSMLAKTETPSSAFDARPITVFSVLYRQWSRYRSREILAYFTSFMPKEVALATNKVPADLAAALVGLRIENSINCLSPLCGIGIDLVRCFNTLPRFPLYQVLRKMGVPERYLVAWEGVLSRMTRTIALGRACSAPSSTSTGVPEGCGMSVVAMAAMSWWAVKTLEVDNPDCNQICYADNWHVLARAVNILQDAIRTLEHFVQVMKMEIAPHKSYLWATRTSDRKILRNIQVNHVSVPVVLNLSDLGCDIQCSKRKKISKIQKRIAKSKRVCGRISKHQAPRAFKAKMAKTSGFAAAAYGTHMHTIAHHHWRTLRSALSKTVSLATAGASPWLATFLTTGDPQLTHLIAMCRFWRRFCTTFPDWVSVLQQQTTCIGISRVGPAASFRHTLGQAGWKFGDNHRIVHMVTGHCVDWRFCSIGWLKHILTIHWTFKLQEMVQHRKDWKSHCLDLHLAKKSVDKRCPQQQWILRTYMTGKQFTHDMLHKYTPGTTPECPMCGRRDSKNHRFFHCAKLEHIRKKHSATVKFAKAQPLCYQNYAIPCYVETAWIDIGKLKPLSHQSPIPTQSCNKVFLFADGSAFHQEIREFALSGFAVISALWGVTSYNCVARGVVPGGEHSSFRGETMALLAALEFAWTCDVFTDCQAVIDNFSRVASAAWSGDEFPSIDHPDLWYLVYKQLCARTPGSVQLHKVKAHDDPSTIQDPILKWKHLGNEEADKAAKSVVKKHPLFPKLKRAFTSQISMQKQISAFHDYICDAVDETFRILQKQKKQQIDQQGDISQLPDFTSWVGPSIGSWGQLPDVADLPTPCPMGETFYKRVQLWFSKLQWPPCTTWSPQQRGMSYLELYVDFVAFSKTEAPFNIGPKRKSAQYVLLDQQPIHRGDGVPLAVMTQTWIKFWKWVRDFDLANPQLEVDEKRPLAYVGYTLRAPFVKLRAKPVCGDVALKTLWKYFHQPQGRRRTMSAPLIIE